MKSTTLFLGMVFVCVVIGSLVVSLIAFKPSLPPYLGPNPELGFILEMHGLLDCVKISENVEKGKIAKVEFRKGVKVVEGTQLIALWSMKAGDIAAGMFVDGKSYVFPSELCRASLALELPK